MDRLIADILKLKQPLIIGVSGFGGSGKSTFAKYLAKKLDAPVVGVDSFCTSNLHLGHKLWDIMDYERMEKEVLIPVQQGESDIKYGEYGWDKSEETHVVEIHFKGILVVEGVGLFRPSLRKYFSFTFWIDCPIDEAMERGKKRDKELYGNPQDFLWDGIWKEQDQECFEKFLPKEYVDHIIDHSKVGEWVIEK